MLDFITVVFQDELPLLEIQARSFDQYLNPQDVNQIVIVVNDADSVVELIDPAWWGQHANRVVIKPRSGYAFAPGNSGWDDQQLLKLLAAAESETKWSIVFDTKTWLIKAFDTQESALFDTQGRPNVGRMHLSPHFEPAKAFVEQYYGIEIEMVLGPSGVPYVFHTADVQEMIAGISDFVTFFQQHLLGPTFLTEFVLYAGFIIKKYGSVEVIYNPNKLKIDPTQRTYINVANLADWEANNFDNFIDLVLESKTLTASIHRSTYQHLTPEQLLTWVLFLEERKLVCNTSETLDLLNTYIK
jgi:hypothetical protein